MGKSSRAHPFAALILAATFLISTPHNNGHAEEKAKPAGMPVSAIKIEPEQIQLWKQFSGNIVAVDSVEIRPQVSGLIKEIKFKDGDEVQKGEVLMIIDPRPFEAALKQAQAALATAKTRTEFAKNELERAKSLVDKRALPERLLDQRNHEYKTALAAVLKAEAEIERARVDLDYANIKAPIAGKVSRAEITEGNLVQNGANAPVLTTIVANDAVYIDFEIDETTYLTSVHKAVKNGLQKIPVKIKLEQPDLTDNTPELKGFMHSIDNRMNPATGTIRGRALFKNKEQNLLPGMTVSVSIGLADSLDQKQILLTERAIGTDQDRKFVFIVNKENKATYREVKIGQSIEGRRVVLSGLKKDEIVITEGLMRIRPNTLVAPKFSPAKVELEKQSNVLN